MIRSDMPELQIPDIGQLLGPYLDQVAPDLRPRFLATLERGAAERYRHWANVLPEHAGSLLACAAGEDEIADRVETLFPLDESMREQLLAPLPGARDAYVAVLAGLDVWDQLKVQASAERQGAQAWRALAATQTDAHVVAELEVCSMLEESSAARLDALVAGRHLH
ncbi:MAG: hypothetical protein FD127_379 [Acidimicrobiaceae bacterium]|jgi:hypothetical protein|nr:MAG: hypothetical protein FD127_379 [Acidimicrobiaceae bacterium]